jgi:pimeloyl-ACP methyl ester carboxylesterase
MRVPLRPALVAALTAGLVAGAVAVANPAAAADLATGGVHAPVPVLIWTDCAAEFGPGVQCATAKVPLDYDRPTGQTIDVALNRHRATDPVHRVGSLFLNPGGPGGSGETFLPEALTAIDPSLPARFDLIGVSPRGTSRSTPVQCFATAAEQEAFFGALPAFPVTAEIPAWLAAYRDYTNRCARVAGPIIDHSSTANFVRDLDLLRQAVGDPGFSFLGYSYGSQVGSTYAAMFPSRVRAVVIDGVVDPVAWSTGYGGTGALLPITTRLKSAEGASDTLGAFFRTCAAAGPARCSFADPGATAGQLSAKWDKLTRDIRKRPVDVPQPAGTLHVTYAVLVSGALSILYDVPAWPTLADVAEALVQLEATPAAMRGPGRGRARSRRHQGPVRRRARVRQRLRRGRLCGRRRAALSAGVARGGRGPGPGRTLLRLGLDVPLPGLRDLAGPRHRPLPRPVRPADGESGPGRRHPVRPGDPLPGGAGHRRPVARRGPAHAQRVRPHLAGIEHLHRPPHRRVPDPGLSAAEGCDLPAGPPAVRPGRGTHGRPGRRRRRCPAAGGEGHPVKSALKSAREVRPVKSTP